MEKIVKQNLLYDFYGELLTTHQRRIYEDVVFQDLSPSEIAQEQGISRQGVHEMVRRCDKILDEFESKLHMVERFERMKVEIGQIQKLAVSFQQTGNPDVVTEIAAISGQMLKEL